MKNLICPVCSHPLNKDDKQKSLQCEHKHTFDLAKQGYVNLLLSQNKKSKHPGDTPLMVQARTSFLNKGHYNSIAATFEAIALDSLKNLTNNPIQNKEIEVSYCDLACGEGFYTERLSHKIEQLQSHYQSVTSTGIDISAPAIKSASRRSNAVQWLVASTARIPLASHSQHLVSGLFFHFDLLEIERILKKDGILIIANTGKNHLIELRQAVYDEIKEEKPVHIQNNSKVLRHIDTKTFQQHISITHSEEIMQLLSMTPHYWRAKKSKKEALSQLNELDLTLDIQFDIYKKS